MTSKGRDREFTERIHFLCRIIRKESVHLESTASRLFPVDRTSLSPQDVENWIADTELSERLDAFVARFSRLQDTTGDKLIPALLELSGESPGPAVDNLDKAEKFGWIDSADDWLLYRKLRNQMIHEYIEDTRILTDALTAGRDFVPRLIRLSLAIADEAEKRIEDK